MGISKLKQSDMGKITVFRLALAVDLVGFTKIGKGFPKLSSIFIMALSLVGAERPAGGGTAGATEVFDDFGAMGEFVSEVADF